MDATMVRVVVAGVIGAHGVGHVMGWMPALGIASIEGSSGSSWILRGRRATMRAPDRGRPVRPADDRLHRGGGRPPARPAWWRPVAAASATVSLAATALFPHAFPVGSTIGSVAVNVLVLDGVLASDWNSSGAAA